MKEKIALAAVMLCLSGVSNASMVDFTDNSFTSITYDSAGPINEFDETVDGVTFSFSASGSFREVGTWSNGTTNSAGPWSLAFGGGGGQTPTFYLTVDSDVTLNSFSGFGQQFNTSPLFSVTGTDVLSIGNSFSTVGFPASGTPVTESFVSGPLSLSAGVAYTFATTNPSVTTLGYITSLDFSVPTTGGTTPTTSVPEPGPLGLLALGLLGLATRKLSVAKSSA